MNFIWMMILGVGYWAWGVWQTSLDQPLLLKVNAYLYIFFCRYVNVFSRLV